MCQWFPVKSNYINTVLKLGHTVRLYESSIERTKHRPNTAAEGLRHLDPYDQKEKTTVWTLLILKTSLFPIFHLLVMQRHYLYFTLKKRTHTLNIDTKLTVQEIVYLVLYPHNLPYVEAHTITTHTPLWKMHQLWNMDSHLKIKCVITSLVWHEQESNIYLSSHL